IAVELRTAPDGAGGVFGELIVVRGERDANQLDLVGDVHGEQGKYRGARVLAEDAQALASASRVAVRHGLHGEQPGRVTIDAGSVPAEHHLGNISSLPRQVPVTGVNRYAPQSDDAGGIQDAD